MKRLGIGMVGGRDSVRVSGHAQRSWYEHLWRVRTTAHDHALEHRSKIHIESASPKNQAPEKCM
jgi:hypothetical protein